MSIVLLSTVGSYYAVTSPQLNKTMLFNLLHERSLELMRTKLRGPIESCKFAPWRFRFRFKVAGPKLKFLDDCKTFRNTFCLQMLLLKFKLLGPEFQVYASFSFSSTIGAVSSMLLLEWTWADERSIRLVSDGLQLQEIKRVQSALQTACNWFQTVCAVALWIVKLHFQRKSFWFFLTSR